MNFTKTFAHISQQDISIAGGKGASLGEMTRAKFPVPEGFVVLTSMFDRFLEETELSTEINSLLQKVDLHNSESVEVISKNIRDLILSHDFPQDLSKEIIREFSKLKTTYVAVRSSATAEDSSAASWAGELDSHLNVQKANLLEKIKNCWASLFTTRAIFYRFEKKLDRTKVSVAVVIQKMIQSQISGICFTVHPVSKDRNHIVIEAGYGLGEAIVGGIITPDMYIVQKRENIIVEKNINRQEIMIVKDMTEKPVPTSKQGKQKLDDTEILKISQLCEKIEKYYKSSQDIEWAFTRGAFYILQSRPITTL